MASVASKRQIAKAAVDQLEAGASMSHVARELASYAKEHGIANQLDMVVKSIEEVLAERGQVIASVSSAHPLDASLRQQISRYVKETSTAKSVEISETVDPSLLGGVLIETPHARLDATIRTKLKRLKNA